MSEHENEMDAVLVALSTYLQRYIATENGNNHNGPSIFDELETMISLAARLVPDPVVHIGEPCDALIPLPADDDTDETCAVCLDSDERVDCITPCQHYFHRECLKPWFALEPFDDDPTDMRPANVSCPLCKRLLATVIGEQPDGLTFEHGVDPEDDSFLTIDVTYNDMAERFYIPNTEPGEDAVRRLKQAFEQRLLFRAGPDGYLRTNGFDLKSQKTGDIADAFPDETYFYRLDRALRSVYL